MRENFQNYSLIYILITNMKIKLISINYYLIFKKFTKNIIHYQTYVVRIWWPKFYKWFLTIVLLQLRRGILSRYMISSIFITKYRIWFEKYKLPYFHSKFINFINKNNKSFLRNFYFIYSLGLSWSKSQWGQLTNTVITRLIIDHE